MNFHSCEKQISSSVYEAIRGISSLLFFFMKKFTHTKKA